MRCWTPVAVWLETSDINKLIEVYTCEWKIQKKEWTSQFSGYLYLVINSEEEGDFSPPLCKEVEQSPRAGGQREKVRSCVMSGSHQETGPQPLTWDKGTGVDRRSTDGSYTSMAQGSPGVGPVSAMS